MQQSLPDPFFVGRDADDAFEYILGFAGWMLEGLDEAGRSRALEDLRASLVRHDTGSGVSYDSAAWLLSARRP